MRSDRQAPDVTRNSSQLPPSGGEWRAHTVSILGLGLKLLKTAQVLKVALLAMSVAGYSLIFSWQFALVLIAVIVFHEYGHLRAMKKFSLPTRGMYLIPFVGGVAIGAKPKSQWQDVYISMMGPVYGFLMTVVFYAVFLVTGNHFAGIIATFSGLINVFNLLPVYPLDGGRVLKSMAISISGRWGIAFLLAFSALCFAAAYTVGFYFLCFFVFIGAVDLAASWRTVSKDIQVPLKLYGVAFTAMWYLVLVAAFLFIIVMIAKSGVPGSEVVLKILDS